jgi:amino acid transporter
MTQMTPKYTNRKIQLFTRIPLHFANITSLRIFPNPLPIRPESSNFQTLVNYFNFASWTIATLLWLRYKQPDMKRPYKVFIGIPILVLLAAIYLVLAPFYENPLHSFYCLLFILLGLGFYVVFVKYQVTPKPLVNAFSWLTYKLQVLADLSMPQTADEDEVDEDDEQTRQEM